MVAFWRGAAPLIAALVLVACPRPDLDPHPDETGPSTAEEPDSEPRMSPARASEEEVRAADGVVLLHIDDVPPDIAVDAGTRFGAATELVEASLSPDEEWLAVTTRGAAHAAGWLVRVGTREPRPAAFQYGGEVEIGPWSGDGRYVVFALEGPAPSRTLSVVDRERLGSTVEASAASVRIPDHDERFEPGVEYRVVEWRQGILIFELDGERHRFDPATREVERTD
jgi:hypothetical protein